MPTGHFLSGPSSDPSARHLLVRPATFAISGKVTELVVLLLVTVSRVRVRLSVSVSLRFSCRMGIGFADVE